MGSMEAARRAGITAARIEEAVRTMTAVPKTKGS